MWSKINGTVTLTLIVHEKWVKKCPNQDFDGLITFTLRATCEFSWCCVWFRAGKWGTRQLCSDESHRVSGGGRQRSPEARAAVLQAPLWVHEGGTAVSVLISCCPTRMFLFARSDCSGSCFDNRTRLRHTEWKEPPTFPGFGESRHLRHRVEMKAPVWSLPSWSKGLGCCSVCHYRATVLLFLALSLHGWGSKLITVSFRLQSCVCSSCLGGGSQLGQGGRAPTSPSSFTDSRS